MTLPVESSQSQTVTPYKNSGIPWNVKIKSLLTYGWNTKERSRSSELTIYLRSANFNKACLLSFSLDIKISNEASYM